MQQDIRMIVVNQRARELQQAAAQDRLARTVRVSREQTDSRTGSRWSLVRLPAIGLRRHGSRVAI